MAVWSVVVVNGVVSGMTEVVVVHVAVLMADRIRVSPGKGRSGNGIEGTEGTEGIKGVQGKLSEGIDTGVEVQVANWDRKSYEDRKQ